ncbi:MAG TPA: class I SAM-dependent methyltransferase [Vicinamibacteria bacterium]|nr:class I SAM-dependent methyltransferase [Vicinamibacteria bacterium]
MLLPPAELPEFFGQIDIYLFDQLLKGRLTPGMRMLDAGSGAGRNLPYFLRHGFDVCAVDATPGAVEQVRQLAAELAPRLPATNFRVEALERLSFPDGDFDAVIASAVLHFARDEPHFRAMVAELWRVLRRGGLFFARLASSIGIEARVRPLGGGRYHLPDGSDRFLVDEALLAGLATRLAASPLEPLKTVNVENQRCMTTWCLRKGR